MAATSERGESVFGKDGVRSDSFLPMLIDRQYRPEVLRAGDLRFDDMVRYMDWASERFEHDFARDGDAVVVVPARRNATAGAAS